MPVTEPEEPNDSGSAGGDRIESVRVWSQSQPQATGANVNVYLGLTASYQSQLPPAHELRELEAILPGAVERLLAIQERGLEMGAIEQSHRHRIEDNDSARMSRGQFIAATVFILGLVATVTLALAGHDSVAKVTGGGTLLGAVAIFVTGKWFSRDFTGNEPTDPKQ